MNQCLRCSKPCEAASVFCETCRSLLRSQLWQDAHTLPEAPSAVPPIVATSSENGEVHGDPLERITSPHPIVQARTPVTPFPTPSGSAQSQPSAPTYQNAFQNALVADQTIDRLNQAAQRIAEAEPNHRRLPRASRLSPLHDISADIRRESTPMPQMPRLSVGQYTRQGEQSEDLSKRMPDLWPWHDADEGEGGNENDSLSNLTDPLMRRHFPNSAETARIEEEDMRRAIAEGLITQPVWPRSRRHPVLSRRFVRIAFVVFAILAIAFLIVDGVLLSFAFVHPHHTPSVVKGPPSLTLSTNVVTIGQTVTLHIQHFSANTHVFLTHDIQEMVQLTDSSALVAVGATGSIDVHMLVDDSWGPGYHTLEAEDVTTRYTASATLQIINAGPTRPSRLLVGATELDLGAGYQGANTFQSLKLYNAGGGSITWAGSSDQPWLMLSPTQGVFSANQTITVAVERANLEPGDYKGTLIFSSNVGPDERIQVQMSVRPLPANVGAVMAITPPVLSFTALDGGSNPNAQMLMITNPGTQPLNWALTGNNPIATTDQAAFLLQIFDMPAGKVQANWLTTDRTVGTVAPHSTNIVYVQVNSHNLLPGVYTSVLTFTGNLGAYNSPQNISVSLTIQPHCGLTLNTGLMSFTAVSGQSNPSNQSLGFGATASCAGVINWKAEAMASWLSVTPASGQLKGATSTVAAVGVNITGLKPATYTSSIAFLAAQSTQSVVVQLIVQPPPPPSAPIIGATPLNLNFNTTQGTTVNTLASSWLGASPTGGSIPAGQTGQVTININTAGLNPNTYTGQIILNGTDANGLTASGSPQTIMVQLVVLPPCTLEQPSASVVAFSAVQGASDPSPQSVAITASGNCSWPLNWNATIAHAPSWLKLSATSGTLVQSGQSVSLSVIPTISGLNVGTYNTQISIVANDVTNIPVQGSPQTFAVTLTVLQPCTLQVTQANFSFTVAQGQSPPAAQSFGLSEAGSCVAPVSWSAIGDANSSSWLVLSPTTTGTGSATVNVSVNSGNLVPGVYSGTITVTASGSGGAVVQSSPQTLSVTLTVTGYTLSGTVLACVDSICSSSSPLPGASLSLVNTTNQTITATADSTGKFTFSNLALGTYTLTATGSDVANNYTGTVTVTLTGNQPNLSVDVLPSPK